MDFFPRFPLHFDVVSLFGVTLLLGIIGGELARRCYFLPKISGYIAVGFLVGPSALNIVTPSLLSISKIFVNISLGLILFALGRHLDFRWLYHDRGIIYMAALESFLTFISVFILFLSFHFPSLHAALAASIAVATSPAVIMMVVNDLQSKGPVTRRTLILTSLNNLFALILFIILLSVMQSRTTEYMIAQAAYRLIGSVVLGITIFFITLWIARFIGKLRENQFILLVGSVMFAIGLSSILKLSSMLTLFVLGVSARNLNYKYILMEVNFGWLANLFFILFFVVTGVYLQIKGIWEATLIVSAFLVIRIIAKSIGVWTFSRFSNLTIRQAWSLCFALTPMAGIAVGMSTIITDFNPSLGRQLMTIIATAVTILNILGPVAVQLAFMMSDEAASDV